MARFPKEKRLALESRIRPLIEEQKLQQWKVAGQLGVSVDFVERACKRLGLKTQRTGPRRGEEHPGWKGGRILVGGYWHRYCPDHPNATKNRYVLEHRLVMESVLGRFLLRNEVVHHIDGNPQNNDPRNLQVFASNGEHLHEEFLQDPEKNELRKERIRQALRRNASLRASKRDDDPQHPPSGHPT